MSLSLYLVYLHLFCSLLNAFLEWILFPDHTMLSHTHKVLPIPRLEASRQLGLFLIRQESKDFHFTRDFAASFPGLAQTLLGHRKDLNIGF